MKVRTLLYFNSSFTVLWSGLKPISFPVIFFLSFVYSITLHAQDPVFSQYYLSPLQLNPGLTGLTDDPRFSANYRNQYPGFNNAYRTYALSYDQYFPQIKGGLGFGLLSDDAGDGILKTIKATGIFSYKTDLTEKISAKMGIEAGIVQSTLNWNELIFGDQIDDYIGTTSPGGTPFPSEETAPEKNKVVYPDLGIGMIIYGGSLYSGLSVRHLNRPDPDFLELNSNLSPRIPMRWTFHAGGSWPIFTHFLRKTYKMAISPSVIIVRQGPFNQVNSGVILDMDILNVGIHYRVASGRSEALIGSIGFKTNELKIGYSFDYTVSGFPLSGGTHEIGIVYILDDGDHESRYNDCLNIFR